MRPFFSSGPCVKHPGWTLEKLQKPYLHRSHRSDIAKLYLKSMIARQKKLLNIPDDYKLALVPGSATGAMEMALWCLLGRRACDVHVMDVFSQIWASDIKHQLKITHTTIFEAEYGKLPTLHHNPDHDLVITLSATTTGVAYPHANWLHSDRNGLVIVDACAAAFCFDIPFHAFDAIAYSWQKGLGGEAAHGMLALSPRALQQLENYRPAWPIPRLLSLWQGDKVNGYQVNLGVFDGLTLNTPSMLALADIESALDWVEAIGGAPKLYAKSLENVEFLYDWVMGSPGLTPMAEPDLQAPGGSVCFYMDKFTNFEQYRDFAKALSDKDQAFDIVNHAYSRPSFRVWCGPTVELEDLRQFAAAFSKRLSAK